jgi:hypothetical protein
LQQQNQWKRMSMALVHCGWMLLLMTPNAVVLSVWMGVLGCLWPISVRSWRIGTASHALMYSAPSLALAALDMTALRILKMLRMAPLLGGLSTLVEQKNWLPA